MGFGDIPVVQIKAGDFGRVPGDVEIDRAGICVQ
jgi:hypothetical protein